MAILYAEALEIIRKHGQSRPLPAEAVGIEQIAGRICADDVAAPMANQPFDNSSRDGYALRAEDIAAAANDNPVTLPLATTIYAGGAPLGNAAARGTCYGIMTGAPLPEGCNAVVPLEQTEQLVRVGQNLRTIVFRSPADKGDFVRRAGEDFKAGDAVLKKSMRLRPLHTLTLATLGISQVEVLRKPKVSVLCTGGEIVEDLATPLKDGMIYNASGPYLRSALSTYGCELSSYGTVGDDAALFKTKLQQAAGAGADIILSTGAVAVGAHDFVPSVLKALGAEILFHQVAVRPGRPILAAKLPDNGPFFFGLPGNPVSTSVGLRFFVHPLVRAMQGLPPEKPRAATVKNLYHKGKSGLHFFMRAVADGAGAEIPQNQQSFMVSPLLHTNAWAVIPEAVETLEAGSIVHLYTNDGDEWLQTP